MATNKQNEQQQQVLTKGQKKRTSFITSRDRMIGLRLTANEYDRCRQLCEALGIRSVSEMARVSMDLLVRQSIQVDTEVPPIKPGVSGAKQMATL